MKADTACLKRALVKRALVKRIRVTVPLQMKTQKLMMKVITDGRNTCMHARCKQFVNENVLMDRCKETQLQYSVCWGGCN